MGMMIKGRRSMVDNKELKMTERNRNFSNWVKICKWEKPVIWFHRRIHYLLLFGNEDTDNSTILTSRTIKSAVLSSWNSILKWEESGQYKVNYLKQILIMHVCTSLLNIKVQLGSMHPNPEAPRLAYRMKLRILVLYSSHVDGDNLR